MNRSIVNAADIPGSLDFGLPSVAPPAVSGNLCSNSGIYLSPEGRVLIIKSNLRHRRAT